jgi:hypothetical protein
LETFILRERGMSKEIIVISRGEMIEHLAKSCFDDIEMNMEKLDDILLYGWKGLENQSNEELISDYQEYICPENPDSVGITLIKD